MALTRAQVDQLKKMPGIDQGLLSTYEKNNATALSTPNTTVNRTEPEKAAERLSGFNAALNVALDKAREQRKDTTLDFMNGVVPKGALPATSFAGVLSQFNSSSAPLEATLVKSASDFAQQQAQAAIDAKNSIRDLALKVAENGGSPETIAAVLTFTESGDIDGAIRAAGAALAAKTKGKITSDGSDLVTTNADGTTTLLYSADSAAGYSDLSGLSAADAKRYIQSRMEPGAYSALDSELNDAEFRQFYEFWMTMNNQNKQTTRLDIAYKAWQEAVAAARVEVGIPDKSTSKKEEVEDDVYTATGIKD